MRLNGCQIALIGNGCHARVSFPEFNIHEGRLGITKGNGQETLRKWQ